MADTSAFCYNIYRNIQSYMSTRNITPTSDILSKKEFGKVYNNSNIFILRGQLPDGGKMVIILATPSGDARKVDAKMKDYIKKHIHDDPAELLYILPFNLDNPSVIKKIKEIIAKFPETNTWIQIRPYEKFIIDISTCKFIYPHTIVPRDEFKTVANFSNITDENIQKIYEHDTPVVWIGGRVGDIIKVQRNTPSTGISITYRKVISM
jgi:DNA-directed RNA polymerase subunit H (RpoH/RPB5)/galactitol-specific phosphotransferase system IIB component